LLDAEIETKWERALPKIDISPVMLAGDA